MKRALAAAFTIVIASAASLAAQPGLAGGDGRAVRDAADARGPLDLRQVRLRQHIRKLVLRVRTRGRWRRRGLTPFPFAVNATGERFLCLYLRGGKVKGKRILLCPGGRHDDRLGVSRVRRNGTAARKGNVKATIERAKRNRIKITLPFRGAGLRRGRFRWSVVSGWSDRRCRPEPSEGKRAKGPGRAGAPGGASAARRGRDLCRDRAPSKRRGAKGRIKPVRLVGCVPGSPQFATHGSRSRKRVALTFDDGPSSYTSRVMRILDRKGVRGTFFVLGSEIGGRADLLRRLVRHKHELANHTFGHETFASSGSLARTSRAIEQASGFEPCRFRPPGGFVDASLVSRARSLGMTTVGWDVDTRDWTGLSAGSIRSRAVGPAQAGSIILMHDGGGNRSQTVAALPGIINDLRRRGFELVTVTQVLGHRFKLKAG